MLLCNFKISPSFNVHDDVVQTVEEDPNIIFEQFLFSSDLDFDKCAKQLCTELSTRYGQPISSNAVNNQGISVACYVFLKNATEVTVQVSCEGPSYSCHGFVHAKTRWVFDPD